MLSNERNSRTEILKIASSTNNDFRAKMVDYIKNYFAEDLSKEDLKLLETDEGLIALQKKIKSRISTRVGNA